MFKQFTYLILFLSLIGLLFAIGQIAASLLLSNATDIRKTDDREKNNWPGADACLMIDFHTS